MTQLSYCFIGLGLLVANQFDQEIRFHNQISLKGIVEAVISQTLLVVFLTLIMIVLSRFRCVDSAKSKIYDRIKNAIGKVKFTELKEDYLNTTSYEGIYKNTKKSEQGISQVQI